MDKLSRENGQSRNSIVSCIEDSRVDRVIIPTLKAPALFHYTEVCTITRLALNSMPTVAGLSGGGCWTEALEMTSVIWLGMHGILVWYRMRYRAIHQDVWLVIAIGPFSVPMSLPSSVTTTTTATKTTAQLAATSMFDTVAWPHVVPCIRH